MPHKRTIENVDPATPRNRAAYFRYYNAFWRFQTASMVMHSAFDFPLMMHDTVCPAHPHINDLPSYVLAHMEKDLQGKRVLDLGTGGGVIALMAAFRGAEVIACEHDPIAIQLALQNVKMNQMQNRITVVESDLFDALKKDDAPFDIITASLWFPDARPNYKKEAEDALNIYSRFLEQYPDYLKEDGIALLTSGSIANVAATEALFEKHARRPARRSFKESYMDNTVFAEWHVYAFARNGGPAAPQA